ncbi:hypothetical protein ElyMa_001742800 [Elysia marginata]|uniref:Uncharacterized protein n=1 Tax=Elysia marginata TaxID=1093978 RepID=A0AAV4E8A7_9GAST|nr:hypothetical protein ElyMa_001742800 [Elysia marginata]
MSPGIRAVMAPGFADGQLSPSTLLFQVPCLLAWAIRDLQPTLQLIFLTISDGFSIFIQSARLSDIFTLGVPLPLFPSNFPVVTKCSSWFLLMT